MREHWSLDPACTYLNHGSFGPSPIVVQQRRQHFQKQLEANPVRFLVRDFPEELRAATQKLANFLGTEPDNLVFVRNATDAMNIVAANTTLERDDEVLLNDHEYGAVIRIWGSKCQAVGAKTVIAKIPDELSDPMEVADAIWSRVTERTKVLVVSHVTSPTALCFPVEELGRRCRERGIRYVIDGPHAIGMRPVNLNQLQCDFYAASCHKWLSAPFGSGFLYVRPKLKQGLKPAVVSWGRSLNFNAPSWKDEFDWSGTDDRSALLAIPEAIQFLKDFGFENFRRTTFELVQEAKTRLEASIGAKTLSPQNRDWVGSMLSLVLPIEDDDTPAYQVHPLQRWLASEKQIELPVLRWKRKTLVRFSAHLYTTSADIETACSAIEEWLHIQKTTLPPR